jgi:hypothetical protein
MWGKTAKSLDFSQVVNLFYRVEVVFHALDCHELAGFDALRFQNLAERAFAFLGDQSVL